MEFHVLIILNRCDKYSMIDRFSPFHPRRTSADENAITLLMICIRHAVSPVVHYGQDHFSFIVIYFSPSLPALDLSILHLSLSQLRRESARRRYRGLIDLTNNFQMKKISFPLMNILSSHSSTEKVIRSSRHRFSTKLGLFQMKSFFTLN